MAASSGLEAAPQARCPAEQGLIDLPEESTSADQVLQALPAGFQVSLGLARTTTRHPPEAPGPLTRRRLLHRLFAVAEHVRGPAARHAKGGSPSRPLIAGIVAGAT